MMMKKKNEHSMDGNTTEKSSKTVNRLRDAVHMAAHKSLSDTQVDEKINGKLLTRVSQRNNVRAE